MAVDEMIRGAHDFTQEPLPENRAELEHLRENCAAALRWLSNEIGQLAIHIDREQVALDGPHAEFSIVPPFRAQPMPPEAANIPPYMDDDERRRLRGPNTSLTDSQHGSWWECQPGRRRNGARSRSVTRCERTSRSSSRDC